MLVCGAYPQRFRSTTLWTTCIPKAVTWSESPAAWRCLLWFIRPKGGKALGCSPRHSATLPSLSLHQPPFIISFLLGWFLWFIDNWNTGPLCWSINLAVAAFMAVSVWHSISALGTAAGVDLSREGNIQNITHDLGWRQIWFNCCFSRSVDGVSSVCMGEISILGLFLYEGYTENSDLWTSKNSGLGFSPVFCYFMCHSPGTYWIT